MTEAIKHCLDLDPDRFEFDLFAEELSAGDNIQGCCASTVGTISTVSCPSTATTVSTYSSECCS